MLEPIGSVAEIFRYPVKSMAGERLAAVEVDWQGLEGDRQYSFCRTEDRSRFRWLSGRDVNDLVRFAATFAEPNHPRTSTVEIQTPEGQRLDLFAPELLARMSEAAGCKLAVLQVGRGIYDSMPVSISTTATHTALNSSFGDELDVRRFRPNLVISSACREDAWQGRRLTFGDSPDSAQLLVAESIPRCVLITVDPDSGVRNPAVMKVVARQFDDNVGVYATPAKPGSIHVGDTVFLCPETPT
jgi:uncharacterized protein YcbX